VYSTGGKSHFKVISKRGVTRVNHYRDKLDGPGRDANIHAKQALSQRFQKQETPCKPSTMTYSIPS
jgi:hypothetical protein